MDMAGASSSSAALLLQQPLSPSFSTTTSVYHTAVEEDGHSVASSEASYRTAIAGPRPASPLGLRTISTPSTPKTSAYQADIEDVVDDISASEPPRKRLRNQKSNEPSLSTRRASLRHSSITRHEQNHQNELNPVPNKLRRPRAVHSTQSTQIIHSTDSDSSSRSRSPPTAERKPKYYPFKPVVVINTPARYLSRPRSSPTPTAPRPAPVNRTEETPLPTIEMPPSQQHPYYRSTTISTANNIPPVSQHQSISDTLARDGSTPTGSARDDSLQDREAQQAQLAEIFRQEQEAGDLRRSQKLAAVNRFNEAFIRESSREKSRSVERESRTSSRRPSLGTSYYVNGGSSNQVSPPRAAAAAQQNGYRHPVHASQPLPSPPLSYTNDLPPQHSAYPPQLQHQYTSSSSQRKRPSSPKQYYYSSAGPTTSIAPAPSPRYTQDTSRPSNTYGRASSKSSKKMYTGASGPVYSQDILGIDSSKRTPSANSTAARPMARIRMFG